MRRVMLMSSAAAVALVVAIPMAVSAASAGTIPGDSALDAPVLAAIRRVEPIRLECEVRSTDTDAAVVCKWSEPTSDRAAAIKLFRYDRTVDPHRTVIHRSENLAETSFTDTHVREGHRYGYAVQVYDVNGRVVGRSSAVWVSVPDRPDREIEVLKLACGLGDSGEWIACEWSSPVSRDAAVVSLWRSVDGGERQLVEQFRPQGPNAYRDAVPEGAAHVTYAVIATTDADRVIGRSRPVTVRIPGDREVEVLKLACGLGDSGEWIACEWSSPVSRDAAVVSLWRSVDGGERQLVEQFRPQGPNAYRDAVPEGAAHVTYAVIATTDADRVIGRSRPVTVRIPEIGVRPVDTRPVDTRPVDTRPVVARPVDTRPVDTRPVDTRPVVTRPVVTRPVDTRPVDTRPVDTRPVDTRPVVTRPVVTRPVDTRPVVTRPVGVVAP